MKILVAIANHGTGNRAYLERLIASYHAMTHDVDVVVLSNIPKDLGSNVEVRVGVPSDNPWSLPFAHRPLFRERLEDYDLFIYSEDDTLIEQRHIDAFFEVTSLLNDDEIAGFMRYEEDAEGRRYVSTIHSYLRWDPRSAVLRGDHTFANYSNEHAACFVATQDQIRRAIASGGFENEPHEGKYDMLCAAATDIYTQCGMTKLICLTRADDFLVHHLPDKYVGRMGLPYEEFQREIEALTAIASHRNGQWSGPLFDTAETRVRFARHSKFFYEAGDDALTNAVPKGASVLSLACGTGATEEVLKQRGHAVTAVPFDAFFAHRLRQRGIETVETELAKLPAVLGERRFDVVLLRDLLHLYADPVGLLRLAKGLLKPGGRVIASTPNVHDVRRRWREARGTMHPVGFDESGVHPVTRRLLNQWLREAGLRAVEVTPEMNDRRDRYARMLGGLANNWLAESFVVSAETSGA